MHARMCVHTRAHTVSRSACHQQGRSFCLPARSQLCTPSQSHSILSTTPSLGSRRGPHYRKEKAQQSPEVTQCKEGEASGLSAYHTPPTPRGSVALWLPSEPCPSFDALRTTSSMLFSLRVHQVIMPTLNVQNIPMVFLSFSLCN